MGSSFKNISSIILMAISYTREYEQLIIFDFKSDKSNLEVVYKLLNEVNNDLIRVKDFLLTKKDRIENIPNLLGKMLFIEIEEIELQEYPNNRELHSLLDHIKDHELSYGDITSDEENILVFYEKISPCRFIDKQLMRIIRKDGYEDFAKLLRELHLLSNKPILRYLLELHDVYKDLQDLCEDLKREKRKFESKLVNGQHKYLLEEIRQSKKDYSRDTILLIEGLLKTEGNYYYTLRRQLDDQYNKIIQSKLLQLNKLVNMQEKVFIDERKIMGLLKEYRKKYLRLQRYIL